MSTPPDPILRPGEQVLLRLGDEPAGGRLFLGYVAAAREDAYVIEFGDDQPPPAATGHLAGLYFRHGEDFVRQPGRILSVDDAGPHMRIEWGSDVTPPAAAERRACDRHCTVHTDLTVTVDGEAHCPLLDVSSDALAILSSETHEVGHPVLVTLHRGREAFEGSAMVRSKREFWEGRFRYGLTLAEGEPGEALARGLARVLEEAAAALRDGRHRRSA